MTGQFDIVINATSIGLSDDRLSLSDALVAGANCYDMMYAAEQTPFLVWAQQSAALNCVDGLGMLVEQAAPDITTNQMNSVCGSRVVVRRGYLINFIQACYAMVALMRNNNKTSDLLRLDSRGSSGRHK